MYLIILIWRPPNTAFSERHPERGKMLPVCTILILIGVLFDLARFFWPGAIISNRFVSSGVRLRSTRNDAAALSLPLLILSLSAASILNSLGSGGLQLAMLILYINKRKASSFMFRSTRHEHCKATMDFYQLFTQR
jgi:hypothetical protein